jgi:hypothetical protein
VSLRRGFFANGLTDYTVCRVAMDKRTSKELEPTPPKATEPEREEMRAKGETPGVRTASKQQFDKAHRKTIAQHAGLFRRLAK